MNLCLSEYSKINSRRERGESHFFYSLKYENEKNIIEIYVK